MVGFLALLITSMRDCGPGRAALLAFDSSPETPVPGENVTLRVSYDLPGPAVTSGTATYAVRFNGIPLPPTTEDLCTQTLCPKDPGIYDEVSSSIFPTGVSGKIVSTISWHDQDNVLLWCVENTWRV